MDTLQKALEFFNRHQQDAYLVGGAARNLLLHEPCNDWDIATTGDAPRLARQLANQLGGFYVHMHDKASRVIVKHADQETILDICPLNGTTIEEDLYQRDFTINAIAIPLNDAIEHLLSGAQPTLIDPLGGANDIKARSLNTVQDGVFQHDPLRMLRAVRFMTRYNLSISQATIQLIKRDASLLTRAAAERIHDELYAILRPQGATSRLRLLDQLDLFTTLMPEFIPARGMPQPSLHYWDVFDHSLETVATFEKLTASLEQTSEELLNSPLDIGGLGDLAEIKLLLDEAEQQGIFQFQELASPVMKLAALLHDIGKTCTYTVDEEGNIHFYHHTQDGIPLAQAIMQRLSASTQDRRLVQQVVAHHMRPGQLSGDVVTPRAIRRYFVDLGPTGINVALVSIADHLSMRGPHPLTKQWIRHLSTVRLLLTSYIRKRWTIMPPRLITADELMHHFQLKPGAIIGQLLEQIAEAQTDGLLRSKEEVLWFVEEKLNSPNPD